MNDRTSVVSKLLQKTTRYGFDAFLIALIITVILAYFIPELGVYQGVVSIDSITGIGVSVIFFFYGLRLSISELIKGLSNWRLHLVVQSSTFILFPLIVIATYPLFNQDELNMLWLGVFYLAALPSTVSSSVVMVAIAKGNLTGAIFNASISSLVGVFLTPLWMGLYLTGSNVDDFMLGDVLLKLIIQVLLPVVLGIMLHRKWGNIALRYKKQLKLFDQSIIILIVYASFSSAFFYEMFEGYDLQTLLLLSSAVIILFFLVYFIVYRICKYLRFNEEDTTTAVFCGSKKSLVHATVMAKVLFTGSMAGILLLPIMVYHAFQLVVVGIIAQNKAANSINNV